MQLVLLGVAAAIGISVYRSAKAFKEWHDGASVGDMSPTMWGVIGFLFGLIGLVVFLIAKSRTSNRLAAQTGQPFVPQQWPPKVELEAGRASSWPPPPPPAP